MSVRIGTPHRRLISASTRNPSSRPGPRNDCPDVRFALSYDALNTNGTERREDSSGGRSSRNGEALFGEGAFVQTVEFVTMAMAFVNERRSVDALRQRTLRELARVRPKAHRAAEIVDAEEIAELVDHLRRGVWVALG